VVHGFSDDAAATEWSHGLSYEQSVKVSKRAKCAHLHDCLCSVHAKLDKFVCTILRPRFHGMKLNILVAKSVMGTRTPSNVCPQGVKVFESEEQLWDILERGVCAA
jgi:hypothetical protein